MNMRIITYALAVLATSCVSYPPPSDHLASAVAAARGAKEAGAERVPQAALQLKLADEQITQARDMMQHGDNQRADYMTLRAYNDAELALAIAREDAARRRAEQVESNILSKFKERCNDPDTIDNVFDDTHSRRVWRKYAKVQGPGRRKRRSRWGALYRGGTVKNAP